MVKCLLKIPLKTKLKTVDEETNSFNIKLYRLIMDWIRTGSETVTLIILHISVIAKMTVSVAIQNQADIKKTIKHKFYAGFA